ncbi:MAG: LptF/LptG family permease [Muribaculaceae bacterium]|nr:LptF/LptG family permease [Muribaculaceae bacterium]
MKLFENIKRIIPSLKKKKNSSVNDLQHHTLGLKILDWYIIRKFIGTYVFAILLLFAIVIVFDTNEKIDSILKAPIKATVFDYFLNFLPYFANQFSPLITFIAVIFCTSKMADNSEIIAILSSGVSYNRFMRPYMIGAAIIAALTFVLSAYVIPPANIKRINYTNTYVKNKKVVSGNNIQLQVSPGVIAYISHYDNRTKTGNRFSLDKFDGKTLKSRLTAKRVQYDTLYRWTLQDYEIRNFNELSEDIHTGSRIDSIIPFEPRDFLIAKNDQEMLTSPELIEYINKQKQRGVANIKAFQIELERRYAMTAASFILTLIGVSLSSRKVRGGTGVNIGVGIALSFAYILFSTVTSSFAVSGLTSPFIAMWIPNMLFALIAIYLYRKASV